MGEIKNYPSQLGLGGDFQSRIGTVNTSQSPLTGAEQISKINELIEREIPNLRFIEKYGKIRYITNEGNRDEVTLEEDAILQRERSKDYAHRWNYYLLSSVRAKKIFNPDDIQWRTIRLGKSIESYAPIRKIPNKKKPEIMTKLIENYPRLARLKLLHPEVSLQKAG